MSLAIFFLWKSHSHYLSIFLVQGSGHVFIQGVVDIINRTLIQFDKIFRDKFTFMVIYSIIKLRWSPSSSILHFILSNSYLIDSLIRIIMMPNWGTLWNKFIFLEFLLYFFPRLNSDPGWLWEWLRIDCLHLTGLVLNNWLLSHDEWTFRCLSRHCLRVLLWGVSVIWILSFCNVVRENS